MSALPPTITSPKAPIISAYSDAELPNSQRMKRRIMADCPPIPFLQITPPRDRQQGDRSEVVQN
jgi:hypothetical protein